MVRYLAYPFLFVLFGTAGYYWFEMWWGGLISFGVFALRVGPIFILRTLWRALRRAFFNVLIAVLPQPLKGPVRTLRSKVRTWFKKSTEKLRAFWQGSWLLRLSVIIPLSVILTAAGIHSKGIMEFVLLFPVPFLIAEIFPHGFLAYVVVLLAEYLGSHGWDSVVMRAVAKLPAHLRTYVRTQRMRALRALARVRRRAVRLAHVYMELRRRERRRRWRELISLPRYID